MVGFCLVVDFHRGGSAQNGATCIYIVSKLHKIKKKKLFLGQLLCPGVCAVQGQEARTYPAGHPGAGHSNCSQVQLTFLLLIILIIFLIFLLLLLIILLIFLLFLLPLLLHPLLISLLRLRHLLRFQFVEPVDTGGLKVESYTAEYKEAR